MAKRSSAFRNAVLEVDHNECVICGSMETLEADHVEPRGMGGVASRDTLDNGMTLCAKCHSEKHAGKWQVERWDRTDKESGLLVVTKEGKQVPKLELWFYLRQEREKVKEEIGLLTNLSLTAGARAMMLYHVFKYVPLLKTGQTAEEYIASLGLDSVKAREEADLAGWVIENGLKWPDGVNASKVALVRLAWGRRPRYGHAPNVELAPCENWQWRLDEARDTSYSTLEAGLVKEGWLPHGSTRDLYVQIPCDGVTWHNNLESITRRDGYYLVRVGKVFPPLRRARGKLLVKDGLIEREIEIDQGG